jgi:hypothetical protein
MFSHRFSPRIPYLKDEDNEIEEEEINAALKRVLILLDQVNDLSKSAK